jgi:hypothetical protein
MLLLIIFELRMNNSSYSGLPDNSDFKLIFESFLNDLPRRVEIGKWLNDNKNVYFAEANFETTSYIEEVAPNPFTGIAGFLQGNRKITKYKETIVGYDLTVDLPYKSIQIDFVPKFPNLSQYCILITFLVSKKDIKFYYAFTSYSEQSWSRKKISSNFKWQASDFLIKDLSNIDTFIDKVINDYILVLTNLLKKMFEIE